MILVYGAGAIGSVVGGMLARAGESVVLYGRDPHIGVIRERGLVIRGIWGEHHVQPAGAFSDWTTLHGHEYEAILLCVRTFDTAQAVTELSPLVGPHTLVVSLQNGLGNCETIAATVGADQTVGARVIFGAAMTAPGEVEVTVYAEEVLLGPFGRNVPAGRVANLAQRLSAAGVPTLAIADVVPYLWAKVLYNGALNPLSALLGWPYGALAAHEATRAIMTDAIREMYRVADAVGVQLPQPTVDAYLAHFYTRQVPATAAHRSSMLQAIERGERTEIDAINGYIVRRAADYNLPVPVNELLVRLIHARESTTGGCGEPGALDRTIPVGRGR